MEEYYKFINYIQPLLLKAFPKSHPAVKAFNIYTIQKIMTLRSDAKRVYTQYKQEIDSGQTSWLSDNLVILGTKECGIYLSMLYRKTDNHHIPQAFAEYLVSIGVNVGGAKDDVTQSHSTSSSDDSSSDECTEEDEDSEYSGDTPMDIVRGVFEKIKPELNCVVSKMEIPPPDGVNLSANTKATKEKDLMTVKNGLKTFEEAISRK